MKYAILYCTVLYFTALYFVMYCTVLYCTVLYCTLLSCTILCCTVLCCIVLYCSVLYYPVLYCAALYRTARLTSSNTPLCSFTDASSGLSYTATDNPLSDLEAAYRQSTSATPFIFVISPDPQTGADTESDTGAGAGAGRGTDCGSDRDALDALQRLAVREGHGGKGLIVISMGRGQSTVVDRAIELAHVSGDWLYLQNCHLCSHWLNTLENVLVKMQSECDAVHPTHRLFLSSMPTAHFPISVLQSGVKLTFSTSSGIRSNMRRAYCVISEEEYDSCFRSDVLKKVLHAAVYFNALLLERRRYCTGISCPYHWVRSDFKSIIEQLEMRVGGGEGIEGMPWDSVIACVGRVSLGGRSSDMWEQRSINSVLEKYFNPSLLLDTPLDAPLSTSPSSLSGDGAYTLYPPTWDLPSVRNCIESYPLTDRMEDLGLHPNAAISLMKQESSMILSTGKRDTERGQL
jgi:Dynein heavy chain region D6 P-loop domain/Dynein heavy chain AAA lid domain